MFSNHFWYGFVIGLGLVAVVAIIPALIALARQKKNSGS